MAKSITLGLLQFSATHDKIENLEKIKNIIMNKWRSADLIILPEYSMFNLTGMDPGKVYELAEGVEGNYVNSLIGITRELNAFMIVTLFERSNEPPKVFNEALIVSDKGDVLGVYRKIHLFDAYGYRESNYIKSGNEPSPIIDVKGIKIAIAICFDIRFPELFRIYALRGAELITIPAAWYKGPLKEETLLFLGRARAHENTVYVAIVNQYGKDFTGRSTVIDPLGNVVLDLGIGEKYVEFTIDLDYINEVRKTLPVLNLRRPDIYSKFMD